MFNFVKKVWAKIKREKYYLETKYMIGYPTTYHIKRTKNGDEVLVIYPGNASSPFADFEAMSIVDKLNDGRLDLDSSELARYKPYQE